MNLVTFDSHQEAVHFNKIAMKEVWVGITDKEKEGVFVKITDGKSVVLPWDYGEPNNGRGTYHNEHCVESVHSKSFNDNLCSYQFGYACEKVEANIDVDDEFNDEDDLIDAM